MKQKDLDRWINEAYKSLAEPPHHASIVLYAPDRLARIEFVPFVGLVPYTFKVAAPVSEVFMKGDGLIE
jgi:hypothetical protein